MTPPRLSLPVFEAREYRVNEAHSLAFIDGYNHAVKVCQNQLAEWAKSCVRVYATRNGTVWGPLNCNDIARQALLFQIEPIKRECEHEAMRLWVGRDAVGDIAGKTIDEGIKPTCRKCGAKLKPTGWEVV